MENIENAGKMLITPLNKTDLHSADIHEILEVDLLYSISPKLSKI